MILYNLICFLANIPILYVFASLMYTQWTEFLKLDRLGFFKNYP